VAVKALHGLAPVYLIALPHSNHLSILLRNACRIDEGKKKMEGKKKKGEKKEERGFYPNQLRLGESLIQWRAQDQVLSLSSVTSNSALW